MTRRLKALLTGGGLVMVVGVVAGFGSAAPGEDEPLSGPPLERATAAALEAVGPGQVVDAEIGDDDGAAFEVEVRLPDGSQVEVLLDDAFEVIASGPDDGGAGDDED
jgi:hypothetical protein